MSKSEQHIPLRTFEGFLKQHAHDGLTALEKRLFDTLFPLFQGRPDSTDTSTHDKEENLQATLKAQLAQVLSPMIEIVPAEAQYRRFAGYNLPRRRYFTLCKDAAGNDHQTLSHELRAYRDPVEMGMVEVIDLAGGCNLFIKDVQVPLVPQTAVAVLIHEPEKLPPEFHVLDFTRLPGLTAEEMFLYRFPYTVSRHQVPRTIDLRFPDVREWFYVTFRIPSDLSDSQPVPTIPSVSPTIARSCFRFEDGIAPVPNSFWDMLPTLINPDLGGGSTADTGSVLLMIGHWMRQHDIAALVFPSARCDSAVVFEGSEMSGWQGWNLVDFRASPPFRGASMTTFVPNPWAWVNLPAGVRLHVSPAHSPFDGSFMVENIVDYWASDYLGQIRALEIARAAHGQEPAREDRKTASQALAFRAFRIGALSLRCLRLALQRAPANEVENYVLELQGLALPYGLYPQTGRVIELWSEMQQRATTPTDMVNQSLIACELTCRSLRQRYPGQGIDQVTRVGADIELFLCWLVGLSESCRTDVWFDSDGMMAECEKAIQTRWLNDELRTRAREFYQIVLSELRHGGSRFSLLCEEGVTLQDAIYQHLRMM